MVVQCPNCSARFRMADEKLQAGGVKVRCSQCKEVFTASGDEGPMTPSSSEQANAGAFDPSMRELGGSSDPSLQLAAEAPELGERGSRAPGNVPGGTPLGMSGVSERGGAAGSGKPISDREAERVVSQPTEAQELISEAEGTATDVVETPATNRWARGKDKESAKSKKGARGGGAPLDPDVDLRVGRGTFLFLGLLLLNGLFAFVLWKNQWQADLRDPTLLLERAFQGAPAPPLPATPAAAERPSSAPLLTDVSARTYLNAAGESLLIVEGTVQATGKLALKGVKIGGRLVDRASERVVRSVAGVPAGVVLDGETLRELRTPRQVARSYAVADKQAESVLSPGGTLPFSAVFCSLPGDFNARAQQYRYELGIASFEVQAP